jgi:hypothetical protein
MALLYAALVSLCGPLLFIGVAYAEGRFLRTNGPIFSILPFLGGGFISVTVWCLCTTKTRRELPQWSVSPLLLAVWSVHYVAVFGFLPSALQLWGRGLIDGIDARVGLERLQEWGEEAVDRYERHQLEIDGKCSYIGGNAPRLAASEVPSWLADG